MQFFFVFSIPSTRVLSVTSIPFMSAEMNKLSRKSLDTKNLSSGYCVMRRLKKNDLVYKSTVLVPIGLFNCWWTFINKGCQNSVTIWQQLTIFVVMTTELPCPSAWNPRKLPEMGIMLNTGSTLSNVLPISLQTVIISLSGWCLERHYQFWDDGLILHTALGK